jgi:trk system potassium uptake protein TrkA
VHIVIMGCGRVGSTLAHILEDRDNTVAVIDRDPEAFRRLRSAFKGDRITGVGFDRAVLIQAGIERADAFAAVSSGDNSNIISARVARETFSVRRVAARIYDPRRAEVYERLGIPTVATVRWTADQMLRKLLPEGGEALWRDPTGKIVLAEVAFSPGWIGEQVSTGSARRSCPNRAPPCRKATWCTSWPRKAIWTGSPRPSRRGEASADARRDRGRWGGRPLHRRRTARERARSTAHRPLPPGDQGR